MGEGEVVEIDGAVMVYRRDVLCGAVMRVMNGKFDTERSVTINSSRCRTLHRKLGNRIGSN